MSDTDDKLADQSRESSVPPVPNSPADQASIDSKSVQDPVYETIQYESQFASQTPSQTPPQPTPSPTAESAQPELPKAFGRYEVRSLLGKGAFGSVYHGFDTQLNREVAIKSPRLDLSAKDVAQKFLQEARQLAQLKHHGIVTVHDVGVDNGQCYIVSEFLHGTSLSDWLKQNRPTWQRAVQIIAALADSLAHAHAQRTVHRDLKPENVILTDDQTPTLVDFGLAINDEASTEFERGRISGTPLYMSPEQARGVAHRIDGRTDIYALGVMLYEMLCGRVPFRSESMKELLRQVEEDEPQPPRQLVPSMPRELEAICLKAMSKKSANRFTTAGDLAEELRQVLFVHDERGASVSQTSTPPTPPSLTTQAPSVETPYVAIPSVESSSAEISSAPAMSSQTPSVIRRAREAERRQVTVLFCHAELFDSAEFLENLDVEEQHEMLQAFQELCDEVSQRYEGTVVQSNEQGFLVCFGYPLAYEDAAQRAVRAGLGILGELPDLNVQLQRKHKLTISPWIGIHTGKVVVEDKGESGGRESMSVTGEARNVATRLENVAEENMVAISDDTFRMVQGFFVCESLGTHKIKGVARRVEVYQVLSESDAQSRIDVAVPTGLTPLTGRDREVGLLQDRWEQATEGMGQVVLIIGEAGLGKSRLIHVIKEHVSKGEQADEAAIIEWRSSPQHENSGLYPVTDFFQRMLAFGSDDAPHAKLDKLVEHLEKYGLDGPEEIALFASLLSLPLDDRCPPLNLTPARHKEKTLDLLHDWLREYAAEQPVLFIVEDLHWVDPSSLEFLGLHVEGGTGDSILTILTFRPEFETPWKSLAHQSVMALSRLTKRQIAEMMQRKTGVDQLPQDVVDQIVERTDGVPLFVEEFTKMVMESGTLREVDGNVAMSASFPIHEIPATLHDLLMARLDRIDCDLDVVQLAATIGREFTYELLKTVSPLDEAALETELGKLVEAELLYSRGRGSRRKFQFKHALVQDASYGSLMKGKRQQFHQQVADALEQHFPDTAKSEPELLAHHFSEAGATDQGIDYWLKAGLRSQQRSDNAEAIHHFRKGLKLVETLDEDPQRDQLELQFQAPLGACTIATHGYASPEVEPPLQRARELCEKMSDKSVLFHVNWGIHALRLVRGEFDKSAELGEQQMKLAEELGDPGYICEAHHNQACPDCYRGIFEGGRYHSEKGFSLYDQERCRVHAQHTGQNSGVTHQSYWAVSLWHLGYPDQAMDRIEQTIALGKELQHPYSMCYALHHAGWVYQDARLGKKTEEVGEALYNLASEQGFKYVQSSGYLYRAAGRLIQGQLAEALEQIQVGLDMYRGTGAGLALPYYLSILADAYAQSGKTNEALQTFEEAFTLVEKGNDRFHEAELWRLKGETLLSGAKEDPSEAESCFEKSLELARSQQAKSWELRTTTSLCRLWQKQNKQDQARQTLKEIYDWFTEGFETPDLLDAKALLDELG